MNLSVGIIGLPGVGKTALFSALTHRSTASGGRSTVSTVPVPDERLGVLAEMVSPKRIVPTSVQFVDVAGLVKGAAQEGGLGGQFLSQLQAVNALAIVLRCFPLPDIGFGIIPTALPGTTGVRCSATVSSCTSSVDRLVRSVGSLQRACDADHKCQALQRVACKLAVVTSGSADATPPVTLRSSVVGAGRHVVSTPAGRINRNGGVAPLRR